MFPLAFLLFSQGMASSHPHPPSVGCWGTWSKKKFLLEHLELGATFFLYLTV